MKAIIPLTTRGERGFTLVELVVVIAILGVLAAVSVPMVNNFLESSKGQAYNVEQERIQRAVDAYRSNPLNTRFTGRRQYPIHGESKTQGPFTTPDENTTADIVVITGNPLGGTKGGQPLWVDDGNGIRDAATEENLNDEDDVTQPGWQVATVARQNVDYIVDSRDYFINFERLVLQGLLESIPPSASPDNQPPGSQRTFVGPYSWYVNSQGIVDSLLFAFPVAANTGYQDVFPSQKQPEGTTPPSIEGDTVVDEGSVYTLKLNSRDPRVVPSKWEIDWGDGGTIEEVPGSNSTATHTYVDGPNVYTISATATDSAGTFVANVLQVQVINLNPIISSVTNTGPINEGGSANITVVDASDPGPNDTLTYNFDCNVVNRIANNIATCSFGDSGNIQVNVRVTDGDGGSATGSTFVTVNNVNPAILSESHGVANEGTNTTITVIPQDRGFDDGLTYKFDCDNDGNYEVNSGSVNSAQCFFADNGTFTVNIRVTDDDGVSIDGFIDVVVTNVAPTATFVAPSPVNEGSPISLSLTSPSDASPADTTAGFEYAFDCGDGSGFGAFGASNSASCSTTDNGTRTVKAKIRDKDLDDTEYTAEVTVDNVAPTATFNAPSPVDEGSPISLSLTSPSDASPADTTAGFEYAFDCGDGSGFGAFGASNSASCSTTDDGTRNVKARIRDKDLDDTEYTAEVTVDNVAPTATFNAPSPINEGSPINLSLTSPSDASPADTTAGFEYAFDCGDGFGFGAFGASNSASCSTTDNGTRMVKAKIRDKDLDDTEYSAGVTIDNVAPTANADGPYTGIAGVPVIFDGSATMDPSSADTEDGLTFAWDFEYNGTTFTADQSFKGLTSPSHTYDSAGTFTVALRVTDKDGGVSVIDTLSTSPVTVAPPPALVIYVVDNSRGGSTDGEVWKYDGSNGDFLGTALLPDVNGASTGITAGGGSFWTVDQADDVAYKYNSSFNSMAGDVALHSDNNDPEGITVKTIGADTYAWVVDDDDNGVYRYDITGPTSVVFWSLHSDNSQPRGIATDGTSIFVVDNDKSVYKYDIDGNPVAGGFGLIPGSGSPDGITTNGSFIWVLSKSDNEIRKYDMSGLHIPGGPITLEEGNNKSEGITVFPR